MGLCNLLCLDVTLLCDNHTFTLEHADITFYNETNPSIVLSWRGVKPASNGNLTQFRL